MRNYRCSAALAVVLVFLLAAVAFAECVPAPQAKQTAKPAGSVLCVPAAPASTGAGPSRMTTKTPQYTFNELVPLTVSEAWQFSGRNYTNFRNMVRLMASVSAQKRGINVPDTKEAGMQIGRLVRQEIQSDPNQLLYAAVDNAVREYGIAHGLMPTR